MATRTAAQVATSRPAPAAGSAPSSMPTSCGSVWRRRMICLGLVLVYPVVANVGYSFTNSRSLPGHGLRRPKQLHRHPRRSIYGFWAALRASVAWTAGTVLLQFVVGMGAALLLNQAVPGLAASSASAAGAVGLPGDRLRHDLALDAQRAGRRHHLAGGRGGADAAAGLRAGPADNWRCRRCRVAVWYGYPFMASTFWPACSRSRSRSTMRSPRSRATAGSSSGGDAAVSAAGDRNRAGLAHDLPVQCLRADLSPDRRRAERRRR